MMARNTIETKINLNLVQRIRALHDELRERCEATDAVVRCARDYLDNGLGGYDLDRLRIALNEFDGVEEAPVEPEPEGPEY